MECKSYKKEYENNSPLQQQIATIAWESVQGISRLDWKVGEVGSISQRVQHNYVILLIVVSIVRHS